MKKTAKICITAAVVLLILWIAAGVTDYIRVHNFEKPIFCIGTDIMDDGGSGHYTGLGYSADIKGNFMPEDEFPGVTEYTFSIFGADIESGIRD